MARHRVISKERLDLALAAYNKELEQWMLKKSERIMEISRRVKENSIMVAVKETHKIDGYSESLESAETRRAQVEYVEKRYKTLKERAAFRKALKTLDDYY